MNRQKWLMFVAVAALLGIAAFALVRVDRNQKLGQPGVKTSPLPDGKINVQVDLPERVLDYTSEILHEQKIVLDMLPKDTSFGQRLYKAPDGFTIQLGVVLMGNDRTSLHKPQFCLRGSGWVIRETQETVLPMNRPIRYDLPVCRLKTVREKPDEFGDRHGVYVYWFVADDEYTSSHSQRMWWMARDLLATGVLQRWAYVYCQAVCDPGQEDAAFERMKTFLTAAVPEFQLAPRAPAKAVSAR